MMLTNYYKYLPVSRIDENWGLFVLNAGFNETGINETYPSTSHPSHHYFSWEKGRVLNEYQLLYITKGEGFFESDSCPEQIIKEGTVLLLFPGEWHRYKPRKETGWEEFWVGFKEMLLRR